MGRVADPKLPALWRDRDNRQPRSHHGLDLFVFPVAWESAIEVRFADGTVVNVPGQHLAETLKALKACQLEGDADD